MKAKQILAYCIGLFLSVSSMAVKVECKKEGLLNRGTHVLISDESGPLSITFRERDVSLLSGEYKSIERIYINVACDFSEQSTTCTQAALDNFELAKRDQRTVGIETYFDIYELLIQRKGKQAKNIVFKKSECSLAF